MWCSESSTWTVGFAWKLLPVWVSFLAVPPWPGVFLFGPTVFWSTGGETSLSTAVCHSLRTGCCLAIPFQDCCSFVYGCVLKTIPAKGIPVWKRFCARLEMLSSTPEWLCACDEFGLVLKRLQMNAASAWFDYSGTTTERSSWRFCWSKFQGQKDICVCRKVVLNETCCRDKMAQAYRKMNEKHFFLSFFF